MRAPFVAFMTAGLGLCAILTTVEGSSAQVIRGGAPNCQAVALTFDLCPVRQGTGYDAELIDYLIEHKADLHPQIIIVDPKTKEILSSYTIPAGAHISVKNHEKVEAGTVLAV